MDIILVDDDPDHRIIIKNRLGELFKSCHVDAFSNAGDCLEFMDINRNIPDLVVSDLTLKNSMDGFDFFQELQKRKIPSQFILVSSNDAELARKKDRLRNGDCCFPKERFFKDNPDVIREKISKKRCFF